MNISLTLAAVAALAATLDVAAAGPFVHRSVHRQLQAVGKVNIVVTMKTKPSEALKTLEAATFETRGEKIESIVTKLDDLSVDSQKGIDALLAKESSSGQPLFEVQHRSWSMNARLFNGATLELVDQLASLPGVESIREQVVAEVSTAAIQKAEPMNAGKVPWGVQRIGATKVWADGTLGQNVVVGIIDTGVRGSHEILKGSMRETHSWYDPDNQTAISFDTVNHGTHVAGTIVGANGIGVAPGAKWIACMACPNTCPEVNLIKCGEWMMCPTDTKGQNKDCSKAAHVINNSWSHTSGSPFYQPVVNAWRAAGIIPVFSGGNTGPNCSSVRSPGDYANVIAVNAMSENRTLVYYSGRGPAVGTGFLKPDVTAPGFEILSATSDNDTSYESWSGVSMATPHVTGAVALLLSRQPTLKYNDIYARLTSTTDRSSFESSLSTGRGGEDRCGGIQETTFPNNHYGHGSVDAFGAYTGARQAPKVRLV